MTSHYHDHYAPHLSEFDRKFRLVLKERSTWFDWVALGALIGTIAAIVMLEVLR